MKLLPGYKQYTRRETQAQCKRYEPGDEDGLIVERSNGKQEPIMAGSKHYEKYAERMDYDSVAPFVYADSGPLFIGPHDWIVMLDGTQMKKVIGHAEMVANFDENPAIHLVK